MSFHDHASVMSLRLALRLKVRLRRALSVLLGSFWLRSLREWYPSRKEGTRGTTVPLRILRAPRRNAASRAARSRIKLRLDTVDAPARQVPAKGPRAVLGLGV